MAAINKRIIGASSNLDRNTRISIKGAEDALNNLVEEINTKVYRLGDTLTSATLASPTLTGTVSGAITGSASVRAHSTTAIPAGGTAGAGILVSSATNFGLFFGSGTPTLAAAQGSLYMRSDGSTTNDRMYVNTDGSTTWTPVTTGS